MLKNYRKQTKKVSIILYYLFAFILCLPFVSCGDSDENDEQENWMSVETWYVGEENGEVFYTDGLLLYRITDITRGLVKAYRPWIIFSNDEKSATLHNFCVPALVNIQGREYRVDAVSLSHEWGHQTGMHNFELTGTLTIPSSVTYLCVDGEDWGFSNLEQIIIPNSITVLHVMNCKGLKSLTIPKSVISIIDKERGPGIYWGFEGNSGLTSLKVAAGNKVYDSRNNCNAIIETASNTLVIGCKNTIIPSSVTSIGEEAFRECTSLTNITIPNSVTSIEANAFSECTSLTNITIPNSVTSIGSTAFEECTKLRDIYALRTNPYFCYYNAFRGVSTSTCTLHVPKGCKAAYQAVSPWSSFENIVEDAR